MTQAKEIMRRLTGLTQQFKQNELSKQFMQRMQSVMPPEEINPAEPQMP